MNTASIKWNADQIARCQRAQKWLLECGVKLTGKKDDAEGVVAMSIFLGSAVDGHDEAKEMLESYALISLPTLVQTALHNCQNTIIMCRDQIREELDSAIIPMLEKRK